MESVWHDLKYGFRTLVRTPRVHNSCGPFAGPRDRREYRDLQADQYRISESAAGAGSGARTGTVQSEPRD